MEHPVLEQWHVPHRAEITPGFFVGRVLPYQGGKGVGPFVFLDHMGPHTFSEGKGVDVPPHPHIGLSTLTYLFEGELDHKDSLGSVQRVKPGDVNWMTAGRGVAHSERSPAEMRAQAVSMHGLQAWVALPSEFEEVDPAFEHCDQAQLPKHEASGVRYTIIAGQAFQLRAPVRTFSRLFYVHCDLGINSEINFDPEGQEAAFYLVEGRISVEGQEFVGPGLVRFHRGSRLHIYAKTKCRGMLLGGDPFVEHRRIWWNFVSTRPERIEEAKRQWKAREFPSVPGETEFVPLP